MSHLPILFGFHASNIGNSHIPMNFSRFWNQNDRATKLYVPSVDAAHAKPWILPSYQGVSKALVYRFGPTDSPRAKTQKRFMKAEENTPWVYLWAGIDLQVYEFFHQRGAKIIVERINCHQALSKAILDPVYQRETGTTYQGITQQSISAERRKLELADSIFCPSPRVYESMLQQGIPEEKLLLTSYGWDPARFPRRQSLRQNPEGRLRFLFAGTFCLRKGGHILLKTWKKIEKRAELIIVGQVEPALRETLSEAQTTCAITHIPYTPNISEHYNQADVFIFPTLEEGGPMVTYEAMAHGLLPLVSPMGAGAIVADGTDGHIVDGFAPEAWEHKILEIVDRPETIDTFRAAIQSKANQFTWERVAAQRAHLLQQRYAGIWSKQSYHNQVTPEPDALQHSRCS